MKFSFDKSIGLEGLPKSSFKLLKLFFIFSVSMRALFMLSNTFYVLYVINIVSYFQLGVLYSVTFLSQALLDYPSGVLGDKYGYKWVLGVSYVLHSISYGLLVIANDFQSVLIIYFIEGIANSQESGALNAWFENSYKKEVGAIDTDRKLFKFYMGKNSYYVQLVSALAFVFGGLLATITFRNYVFFIQSIGMFFIAIFIFLFLYSPKKADTNNQKEENYFQLFVNGITFTVKNKKIFYYVLGQVLIFSTYTIWNSIILFPLYFSYTGSDLLASILRFSIWFTSSLFFIRIGSLAKRLESSTWIPRLFLAVSICLFGFFSVLVFFHPGSNTFNLLGIILVFIMLLIYSFIQGLNSILIDSLNLDLIPDTNRNSYYSLLPTLILFISTPLIIIAGQTIELFGLSFFAILLCILVIIGSLFISHGLKKDQSYTKDPVLTPFTTITQQVD